jgi:hypothetical protein
LTNEKYGNLVERGESVLNEGVNHQLYFAYQANAIIGMIIEWYQNDFSYDANYLNNQLVQILNMKINT